MFASGACTEIETTTLCDSEGTVFHASSSHNGETQIWLVRCCEISVFILHQTSMPLLSSQSSLDASCKLNREARRSARRSLRSGEILRWPLRVPLMRCLCLCPGLWREQRPGSASRILRHRSWALKRLVIASCSIAQNWTFEGAACEIRPICSGSENIVRPHNTLSPRSINDR